MTSLYASFAKNCILPSIDIFYGSSVKNQLRILDKSQWFTPEKLRIYQLKKLKLLIKHAYSTVPFYSKFFKDNSLKISDFNQLSDLEKLPIINKTIIGNNLELFISQDYTKENLVEISTGGTTGKPFKSYTTKFGRSFLRATGIRGRRWGGYNYGDKVVTLAGSSLVPNEKVPLSKILRNLFERNLPLSATHLSDSILFEYVEKIVKHNPKIIRGYPSAIYVLAKFINENNLTGITPSVVITTAEVLLDKHREFISSVFGCRVCDNYSNPESLANAYECEYNNLHLGTDVSLIEILDTSNEIGKIVATDLNNYGMPIIRYDTEDMARLSDESCECGRVLPIINSLQGRSTDIIRFSNGHSLGGPALTLIFQNFSLDNYQIVQESEALLSINLVKSKNFREEEKKRIEEIMRHHCGKGVDIKINIVSEIEPPEKGKKWRFIISKV
tara:strand:+ start:184 stop:1515 length:1332 start_codon:yes stop_codon:yes gene_type:complete